MKLHNVIAEALKAAGVGAVSYGYELPGADRFTIEDDHAARYTQEIQAIFSDLAEKGYAAKDFHVMVGDGAPSVRIERDKRFVDKFVIAFPAMQSVHNTDPRYDLTFDGLLKRLMLARRVISVFAEGMQNAKLGVIDVSLQHERNASERASASQVDALEPALRYWFTKLDAIDGDRIEFRTGTDVRMNYYKRAASGTEPATTVVSAFLPRETPKGEVAAVIEQIDEAFDAILKPVRIGRTQTISIVPGYGLNFQVVGTERLKGLSAVTEGIRGWLDGLDIDLEKLDLSVTLGEALGVEVNRNDYADRIDVRVPCLSPVALREAESYDAYIAAGVNHWNRCKRVIDWMKTDAEGKVLLLNVSYDHLDIALEDAHMEALLSAIAPHLQAYDLEKGGGMRIRIEGPGATPMMDAYGGCTIPLDYLEPEAIGPAIEAFFADFPVKQG